MPSNSRTSEFVLERRNFLVFLLSKVCNGDFGLKSALIRRKNAKILLSGATPKGVPINYVPIETANDVFIYLFYLFIYFARLPQNISDSKGLNPFSRFVYDKHTRKRRMLKSSNEQIGNKFDSPKMKTIAKTITEESNPVVSLSNVIF